MGKWLHADAEAELGDTAVHCLEHAGRAVVLAFLAEFERAQGAGLLGSAH